MAASTPANTNDGAARRFRISPPALNVPAQSCDCHTHVFGPHAHFPLAGHRHFTPLEVLLDDLHWAMRRLGFHRAVLVQPSVYGTDNRLLMESLAAAALPARGVAVVGPDISHDELRKMHDAGMRGIRLNVPTLSAQAFDRLLTSFAQVFAKVRELGWHVDIYANASHFPVLLRALATLSVPVVINHLGGPPGRNETVETRVDAFYRLLATGKCWIKLSAPYRLGAFAEDSTLRQLIGSLLQARPDRLLWGSDWPHTPRHDNTPVTDDSPSPFQPVDTGRLLDEVGNFLTEAGAVGTVLRDNPRALLNWD
ncbi:MAG: amidohydrolase family protein [Alphaproteobacteria bacterium]|nr:amidohydrolase family protein [Alphaproteobacteria bacterium]